MNLKNFELREWQLSDTVSFVENENNIHICNTLRDALPHLYIEEDAKQFITREMNMPKPATLLAIVVDDKAVGSIGITLHTDVKRPLPIA